MVGQAAALGFHRPFVGVAVAVEDDALMLAQVVLDVRDGGRLELFARLALHGIGELLQALRHGRVQNGVRVGEVHRGARHAELELVAGEGERARAVAVSVVLQEVREHGHAQIHCHALGGRVLLVGDERIHDGAQLVAQEDGHDRRRGLVGAQAMVVAGRRHGHAQELLVIVDRLDDARQKHEEAQILHRVLARIEQVLLARGNCPVVVLARAVDALEGLFMLQADKAVVAGEKLHLLHREQVLIDSAIRIRENRRKLVLRRSDLVVLGLRGNAELPQLVVELFHELVHRRANGAEVVLFKFLALARRIAEQRTAGQHKVKALGVVLLGDEEVLLLGADRGNNLLMALAEELEHAVRLLIDSDHGTQKRRLLVERLAGIAAERGGDAQHLVLHERVARRIPRGVAAGLEGGAQTARGEARRIGFALNELLAGKALDRAAVGRRVEEGVMLLGRDAGKRLEPVRVVRGSLFDRPFLHSVGNDVRNLEVERLAVLDGPHELLVRCGRQTLLHGVLVEHHRSVDF